MIRIGCQSLAWANYFQNRYSVERVLDDMKESGFENVELMEPLERLGGPQHLKQLLKERNIRLASITIVTGMDMSDKEKLAEAKQRIAYAAALGVKVVPVCGGFPPEGEDLEFLKKTRMDSFCELLEELGKYAQRHGVEIAFHPHLRCLVENEQDIESLLARTSLVQLCLDTAHLAAAGTDPVMVVKKHAEKIKYVHLKDFKRHLVRKPEVIWDHFVELGEGDIGIDFSGFLKALEDIRFDGYAVVELDRPTRHPLESFKMSRQFLRNIGY